MAYSPNTGSSTSPPNGTVAGQLRGTMEPGLIPTLSATIDTRDLPTLRIGAPPPGTRGDWLAARDSGESPPLPQ